MISLICLPLLCICYFAYQGQFQKWAAIDMHWFNDTTIEKWNKHFESKINIRAFDNYPNFYITGNENNNRVVVQEVQDICKQMIRNKEYGKGVTVNFTGKSKYRDLVNIIDAAYSLKEIGFIPYNDKVFITVPKPYKPETGVMTIDEGGLIMCGTVTLNNEPSLFNKIISFLKPYYIFWPSIIPFLLMLFFAFRRQFKIHPSN
ncbi:hypothetical protein EWM62_06085 [Mucilaginibacter terrigena]|uniref:Uncharacterized protein n=1 Tax=Mucilaginibacter terrigena TaxID=2492395 RepID=A0A4Q5LQ07_9SPHI|nr:hypothetical protein [Mucilaginibacter terrigena]RYU91507.1 hypothetical protein EWM62_06085 [Mucilaginibacter terrigena]